MEWRIPGSVLSCPRAEAEGLQARFEGMFLGGDISLSQVVAITGLEAHTIQNWVKRGFLTPPKNKHYSLRQLCRLLNIHMLRGSMSLDKICALLGYVNGRLDDEGDDIIDDTALYFLFLRLGRYAPAIVRPGNPFAAGNVFLQPTPGRRLSESPKGLGNYVNCLFGGLSAAAIGANAPYIIIIRRNIHGF